MRFTPVVCVLSLALLGVPLGCSSRAPTDERLRATSRAEGAALEAGEGEQRFLGRERVATLIKVDPITMGARELFVFQRVLDPSASLGKHRHERDDEIIFVHAGELTASIGGVNRPIGPGAMLFVPAGAWMDLWNESKAPATVLIVFAAPHMADYIRSLGTRPGEPKRDLTPDLLRDLASRHHVTFANP
ncbi:MAG: cupin domain-containing protein [Thermoanaerobaculia bacterium]